MKRVLEDLSPTYRCDLVKRFLLKIYLILTLDCEQSAHLTSDSFDRDLDWSERVASALHRLICGKSRKLHHQLIALNETLESGETTPELGDDARARILAAVKDREK